MKEDGPDAGSEKHRLDFPDRCGALQKVNVLICEVLFQGEFQKALTMLLWRVE